MINTGNRQGRVGTASVEASRRCLPRWAVRLADLAADHPSAASALLVFVAWTLLGAVL